MLGDECPDLSSFIVVVSVPKGSGDDEGDWDSGDMGQVCLFGREQRRMVFPSIQGLVRHAGFPTLKASWMYWALQGDACVNALH